MRTTLLAISAAALALAACGKTDQAKTPSASGAVAPASAGPASLPARKAGLWIQTMSRDGAAGRMGQMRICIDSATDAKMSMFGQKMGKSLCQGQSVSRGLDGAFSSTSTCSMGQGGTITSKGTVTGDFSSKYHVHSESDIAGASLAAMNGHHVTDIDGVYAGPCPADMAPGDISLANGMKINAARFAGGVGDK